MRRRRHGGGRLVRGPLTPYRAPLEDLRFLIETWLDAGARWAALPPLAHVDAVTALEVLRHAAAFAEQELAPLNASGDREACSLVDHRVRTPAGFCAAYRAFIEGGWAGLGLSTDIGGQGLPQLVDVAFHEMQVAANHAWAMYPGLLHGAVEAIRHHASPALREVYLPRLVSGEWLAAMGLTEAQAGSDLGLIRTRASEEPDGSLRVNGEKLFMSGGDHDLTTNIVHLVLCRLDGAPPGARGLSLVLAPKFLPDGQRNGIVCEGIEHKLGLHGSATCAIRYDDARGWLVGQPNGGLKAMFLMMNSARLRTGMQGIAHAEAALQLAREYARDRLQGRSPIRTEQGRPADPIARHPAVARKLQAAGAFVEGARAVAAFTAMRLDEAAHHPEDTERKAAEADAGLLTPIIKAFFTQQGFRHVNELLQVFGGYGYLADYGIEQKLRDCRSSLIYEGTNEIQAIDLLVRKVLAQGTYAAGLEALLARVRADCVAARRRPALQPLCATLEEHCGHAAGVIAALRRVCEADPLLAYEVADDFLAATGWLLLGWAWLATARSAAASSAEAVAVHKLEVAQQGFALLLDEGRTHWWRLDHVCSASAANRARSSHGYTVGAEVAGSE